MYYSIFLKLFCLYDINCQLFLYYVIIIIIIFIIIWQRWDLSADSTATPAVLQALNNSISALVVCNQREKS